MTLLRRSVIMTKPPYGVEYALYSIHSLEMEP
jgi:hypothetical protein